MLLNSGMITTPPKSGHVYPEKFYKPYKPQTIGGRISVYSYHKHHRYLAVPVAPLSPSNVGRILLWTSRDQNLGPEKKKQFRSRPMFCLCDFLLGGGVRGLCVTTLFLPEGFGGFLGVVPWKNGQMRATKPRVVVMTNGRWKESRKKCPPKNHLQKIRFGNYYYVSFAQNGCSWKFWICWRGCFTLCNGKSLSSRPLGEYLWNFFQASWPSKPMWMSVWIIYMEILLPGNHE